MQPFLNPFPRTLYVLFKLKDNLNNPNYFQEILTKTCFYR